MNTKKSSKNVVKERRKKISESDTDHHRHRSKNLALAVVKISPTKKKVSDLRWLPTELELRSRRQSHCRQNRRRLLMRRFPTSTATVLQQSLLRSWQNMASKMAKVWANKNKASAWLYRLKKRLNAAVESSTRRKLFHRRLSQSHNQHQLHLKSKASRK